MILSFTIPDDKVNELRTAILRDSPVPLDSEGQPIMNDLAWIKHLGVSDYMHRYEKGKRLLAQDTIVNETDLIS